MENDSSIRSLAFKHLMNKEIKVRNSEIIESYLSHFDHKTYQFGEGIYSPKWISTFYTLRDLAQFNIDDKNPIFQKGIDTLLNHIQYERIMQL